MFNVSQEYLNFINDNNNIGRSMKNKVVIDGVEYLSDTIKSNPKISHKATSFIGGFPSKTCDFEILNIDGSLSLNNKEIEVYKSLEINGSTEWVKMGIFNNSEYAVSDMSIICPVIIPATTLAEERQFTFRKSQCPKGPDAFIKEHLEEFTQSGIWLLSQDNLVYKYIDDVQKKYGILLDKSAVDFSTQFCWEVL